MIVEQSLRRHTAEGGFMWNGATATKRVVLGYRQLMLPRSTHGGVETKTRAEGNELGCRAFAANHRFCLRFEGDDATLRNQ
jgi:hypothetical protein